VHALAHHRGARQTQTARDTGVVGGTAGCAATGALEAGGFALFVGPGEEGGDEEEDLEFLGVAAV